MIYLYGKLREVFGETINCKVHSVQELVRAAEANRPGFKDHILRDRQYVIRRGSDFRKAKDVEESEATMCFGESDWHVVPMPAGYSGAFRVVLGAVLIAVGAVANVYGFGIGTPLMQMGAAMMIGGVASMLAPAASVSDYSSRESADERPSYLFDGPTNRVSPGGAVPLVYGFDVFIGSIFTSGGLEVSDVKNNSIVWGISKSLVTGAL